MDHILLTVVPEDLAYENEVAEATGIPGTVLRQWARRRKIHRFPGDGRPSGNGTLYRTMYSLPEVREAAASYRPRRAA